MKKSLACDVVRISTKDNVYEGQVMPNSDKEKLVLKLKNGYNIVLLKKHVQKTEMIKDFAGSNKECVETLEEHQQGKALVQRKDLPVISILHTGGTIASEIDYQTGGVIARYTPEELLAKFPELQEIATIHSRLISNMWSEDMRFAHYNIMAKEIQKEIKKGVKGIIITHGTDTLGYTAAALSFILEGLNIPILLVGAQRSSDRGSSDAALNILSAARFIVQQDFAEVGICMHAGMSDDACVIMPGTKTRKLHASRRDAFKVVNGTPYAMISREGTIEILDHHFKKRDAKRTLQVKLFDEKIKVGILKAHPNMTAQEIDFYKTFDGLVLEGFGLAGHFPLNKIDNFTKEHEKILHALTRLAQKMPVVATTQTIFGRINMNVYSTGRKMIDAGILGNYCDMITETAFIKLAWLLSNYKKEAVKKLYSENLRGEISLRHEAEATYL